MKHLTLVSGPFLPLSPRIRRWLAREQRFVPFDVVAPGSRAAQDRFPSLECGADPKDLIAVADDGRVWRGASAWVMTLWALCAHRRHVIRLARTGKSHYARRIVELLSYGEGWGRVRTAPSREGGPLPASARPSSPLGGLARFGAAVLFLTAVGQLAWGLGSEEDSGRFVGLAFRSALASGVLWWVSRRSRSAP